MASQTFVAMELFGALWHLGLFTALWHSDTIQLPFDVQFVVEMRQRSPQWQELLKSIEEFCGFERAIMLRERESNPWMRLTAASHVYSRERLIADLVVTSGQLQWIDLDLGDTQGVRVAVQRSTKSQLCDAADSLLQGRFCFSEDRTTTVAELTAVLACLRTFIGSLSPWAEEEFSQEVMRLWMNVKGPLSSDYTGDASYREWLSTDIVRQLH